MSAAAAPLPGGMYLTLVWVLGFFPVWVLGVVDYHGSRLVALEPLPWPTAAAVVRATERAFAAEGAPERVLTDRGAIFRSHSFEQMLSSRGITHTLTRPRHPWTNGRIERLFRTWKEAIFAHYWLVPSRVQLAAICADFVVFYNGHRPHSAYGGRTPDEVHAGRPVQPGHALLVEVGAGEDVGPAPGSLTTCCLNERTPPGRASARRAAPRRISKTKSSPQRRSIVCVGTTRSFA